MIKFFSLVILVFGIALAGLYFSIDSKVATRLDNRQSETVPAILSDVLRLKVSGLPPLATIEEQLQRRRYRKIEPHPTHSGEYSLNQEGLEVFPREFLGPDGSMHHARLTRITVSPPSIATEVGALKSLDLEPQAISNLGDGEQRASNYKSLSQIPGSVQQAVLAIEDERFYQHYGVDFFGIARAMLQNLMALAWVQGGSTITQQLAKNILFSPEKTLGRKVMELLAAISMEQRLSKDQILEMYLNEVYLGQEGAVAIHGMAEASSNYFGKKLDDISLGEAALLAGIIKAPSYYSPRRHLARAETRRDTVLAKMNELGYIKQGQYQKALKSKIDLVEEREHKRDAPYFVAALKSELDQHLNVDAALLTGLRVNTGIDPLAQSCAENAVTQGLEALEKQYPKIKRKNGKLEAGLVAIEPYSGKIKAWVGGRDFSSNQFNHVNQAVRQIGSTIKPFLYLTALDPKLNSYKTATVTSILSDSPVQLSLPNQDIWEPENYDHKYRGDVTLRYALENSLNIPAVYVAQRVGFDTVASTISKFQVADNILAVPSLALGAIDTTLLKLTAAFGALANGGIYVAPRLYVSAVDSAGDILAASDIVEQRVADENAVFVLTNVLQGVIERGTGAPARRAGFTGPAAGKTGTSNDSRDAWFLGFTPNLVVGVWVGYDDNSKIGLTGGRAAAPIWGEFMKCSSSVFPATEFLAPTGVEFVEIDSSSGQRTTTSCPDGSRVKEVFIKGTAPQSACRFHGGSRNDEIDRPGPQGRPSERKRNRSVWDMLFG